MAKNKKNNRHIKTLKGASYIFTRETFGMTILLFCALVLVMLFTGSSVFAGLGKAICTFMYGSFGYGSVLIIMALAYFGAWLVFEKKINFPFKPTLFGSLTLFAAFLLFHVATTKDYSIAGYGKYITECYKNAASGFSGYTFGGVISASIVYPVIRFTRLVGAYIIFSLLTIAGGYFFVTSIIKAVKNRSRKVELDGDAATVEVSEELVEVVADEEPQPAAPQTAEPVKAEAVAKQKKVEEDNNPYSQKNLGRKILFAKGEFDAESYRRNMIFNESSYFNHPVNGENDYMSNFSSSKSANTVPQTSYETSFQDDVLGQPTFSAPSNYVYGDKPVEQLGDFNEVSGSTFPTPPAREERSEDRLNTAETERNRVLNESVRSVEEPQAPVAPTVEERRVERRETELPDYRLRTPAPEPEKRIEREEPKDDKSEEPLSLYDLFGSATAMRRDNVVEPDVSRLASRRKESKADVFDDDNDSDDELTAFMRKPSDATAPETASGRELLNSDRNPVTRDLSDRDSSSRDISEREILGGRVTPVRPVAPTPTPAPAPMPAPEEPAKPEAPKHVWKKYIRPGVDLLDDYPEHNNVNAGEIEDNKLTIVETLARFKIESEISNVVIGPAVTRYDIKIADKTKLTQQLLKYREPIAMALMKENVTAYLNYAKGAFSIEVPNTVRAIVGLKGLIVNQKFINCKNNSLTFALGKNIDGDAICPDITRMPHLLVAGTTGSGKSICLRALIISLLYKYGPDELRFILVDPKQVEFICYDRLPHLMVNEIIYDVNKTIKALNWAKNEMERRYTLFKEMTTERKLATSNLDEYNSHLAEGEEKLPKIVIILDEFGDLMLQAKKDMEDKIIKLAQKSRAAGIHLILATQRPSVDCITGLIKANLPTKIGFKVNSYADSGTIFGVGGAEKLLGKGDMYFRSGENPDMVRVQGCLVEAHEAQKVADFVREHNETFFDKEATDFINTVEQEEPAGGATGDEVSASGDDAGKTDDNYLKALHYCVEAKQASVSMIQRRFPVGYIKACKIIDWMENMNYVSRSEGSKPRKVLLTMDEFIATFGEIDD